MAGKVRLVPIFVALGLLAIAEAGIIKDIYQKITHSNNKTEETVKQSAPICGSGIFSTPDEKTLSPEIIFITSRPIKASSQQGYGDDASSRRRDEVNEVAREFRFHEENVTLADLERHGFNRDAPVSFLMHGFTSGYPLQAWISAIVEAYTIDRKSPSSQSSSDLSSGHNDGHSSGYNSGYNSGHNGGYTDNGRHTDQDSEQERRRDSSSRDRNNGNSYQSGNGGSSNRVNHNLFIINWNFAARGINYPRAVANIPIVASYATRFINDKLLGEARMDPRRIQLIGHSLGAHLAGFIGKNTRSKLGRIYGLDPAGPCFGTLVAGPLYPASKRLAPTDAEEVITVHTNSALLGIDKPIGKYSVFVEGGEVQPGCKGGGVFKSLQTLTWDGGDFDTIACSHSRAPNLLTYRHDQSDSDDDCQLVAYECKDWNSFVAGHCGVCSGSSGGGYSGGSSSYSNNNNGPSRSVECLRIGLDWQYPKASQSGGHSSSYQTTRRPTYDEDYNSNHQTSSRRPSTWNNGTQDQYSTTGYGDSYGYSSTSTRRPYGQSGYQTTSGYGNQYDSYSSSTRRPYSGESGQSGYNNQGSNQGYQSSTRRPQQQYDTNVNENGYSNNNYQNNSGRRTTRRPGREDEYSNQRNRRAANETSERRGSSGESSGESKKLFLRTGDTQPYCAYQYQIILELNEPFPKKKPHMSLLVQDSEKGRDQQRHSSTSSASRSGQNSLSNDEFGNKFDDRTYTHLLTSGKKLGRVDHATLLFRDGLPEGIRILKALHVNYMSHIDPNVRRRLSARLCPVRKSPGTQGEDFSTDKRFYFEPCSEGGQTNAGYEGDRDRDTGAYGSSSRRPTNDRGK